MRSSHLIIQLLLLLLLSPLHAAASLDLGDIGRIDPDIAYVASGGMWTEGARYGSFRLIVIREGVEHTATSAFAQWLCFDESRSKEIIVASEPVADLRRDLSDLIVNVTFDYSVKESGEFILNLRDRASGSARILKLRLGKPGEIRLSQ